MLKKIAYTFQTSTVNALLSFLTVWLTVRFLGAEGQGTISLLLINISIVQIFSSIVGGSALVYLVPRYGIGRVLFPASIWACIISVLVCLIMSFSSLITTPLLLHTIILSLLQSLILNNSQILIAKDNIQLYNFCRLMQPLLVLIVFTFQLFIVPSYSIGLFLTALYCSYSLTLILSSYFVLKDERLEIYLFNKEVLKLFFQIGGLNQVNNILQLSNYRFSFYMVEKSLGTSALGIFSLGVSLTEAVWLLSRNISTIHYAEVSRNEELGVKNNERLIKACFVGTVLLLAAALLLPVKAYSFIFGNEFKNVKKIILLLSPGVISLASAMILSYYFSAVKKLHLNTISSGAGSLTIVIFSFLLIPYWGIEGAALANTLSYIVTAVVIFFQYNKLKKLLKKI